MTNKIYFAGNAKSSRLNFMLQESKNLFQNKHRVIMAISLLYLPDFEQSSKIHCFIFGVFFIFIHVGSDIS